MQSTHLGEDKKNFVLEKLKMFALRFERITFRLKI